MTSVFALRVAEFETIAPPSTAADRAFDPEADQSSMIQSAPEASAISFT